MGGIEDETTISRVRKYRRRGLGQLVALEQSSALADLHVPIFC